VPSEKTHIDDTRLEEQKAAQMLVKKPRGDNRVSRPIRGFVCINEQSSSLMVLCQVFPNRFAVLILRHGWHDQA